MEKAPVTYKFVSDPDKAFAALRNDLDWERRGDAPRCEYYCNDTPTPYVYGRGKGRRLYEPRPYHPVIREIRKDLEALTGATFEVCFLNRYLDQKDQLGWHADDSPEMDDARPIGIVSLVFEREIWFKQIMEARPELPVQLDPERLKLQHGSLALMAPGMQNTHMHRIPKSPVQCGERISLTFRGYIEIPSTNP
jgi:alkylated DNA repair dioxygenase AlkB